MRLYRGTIIAVAYVSASTHKTAEQGVRGIRRVPSKSLFDEEKSSFGASLWYQTPIIAICHSLFTLRKS